MELDRVFHKCRIEHVGPEDRALLRSNPSAAVDAGMRAWRWSWDLATSCTNQRSHPGRKAINLGVWSRAPAPRNPRNTPTGVPYGNILRACLIRLTNRAERPGHLDRTNHDV